MIKKSGLYDEICHELNIFASDIEIKAKNNLTDDNVFAEDIIKDLLNVCKGWDLVNLNAETENFPGIDLGDKGRHIGVQISTTKSSKKISESLKLIIDNNVSEHYNKIYFFILGKKQKSYSIDFSKFDELECSKNNIWDIFDIIAWCKNYSSDLLEQIWNIIKNEIITEDDRIKFVLDTLKQDERILDAETIHSIYHTLSDMLWKGRIEDIYNLLPFLDGKNNDLELAIKIKLALLSSYNIAIGDPLILCQSIKDRVLRDDIIRLLVLENFNSPNNLKQLTDLISDSKLKEAVRAIINNTLNTTIIRSEQEQNTIAFKFDENYHTERWLLVRLFALSIDSLNVYNKFDFIKSLIEKPNFLDKIILWEIYLQETIMLNSGSVPIKTAEFLNFVSEMKSARQSYTNARNDLEERYYYVLVRGMFTAEDSDLKEVLSSAPDIIVNTPKIASIGMALKIKDGEEIDQETLIKFVLETKEYLPIIFYCEREKDYENILSILDQIKWIIGQNIAIFFYALNATNNIRGSEEALVLLKEYEDKYSDNMDYWIQAYHLIKEEKDRQWVIESILKKLNDEGFTYGSLSAQKGIANILARENHFSEALVQLSAIEAITPDDMDVIRMEIMIYMNSGRLIDALAKISDYYEQLDSDSQMIDRLLSISLTYNRPIEEKVLCHAKTFSDSRILMLTAQAEYIRGNVSEAKKQAMRSILISSPGEENIYDFTIEIFTGKEYADQKELVRVKEDTCFTAENLVNGTRKIFCIYKEKILPEPSYKSHGSLHIYVEDAIKLNFFRLSVGDNIDFENESYRISEISPLDVFYFRICIDYLMRQGRAWTVSGNDIEEMVGAISEIFKQNPSWQENAFDQSYNDFSKMPLPIYMLKLNVNAEYGQLMRFMMDSETIIIRDGIIPFQKFNGKGYIITFTALVALQKLGVDADKINSSTHFISNSTYVEIERESDKIFQRYSRDLVATMGLIDDWPTFFESSEDEKRENLQQGIELKQYAGKFQTLQNDIDLDIPDLNDKMIDVYGVCDYDVIALAKEKNLVLVTEENFVLDFAKNLLKIDVVGIIDFLCHMNISVDDLFTVIEKMFNYRFYAVITPTVIIYLMHTFDEMNEQQQEYILKKWNNLLFIPETLSDRNYRIKFKEACNQTNYFLNRSEIDIQHPIVKSFVTASFYYNDFRIAYQFKDGKLYLETYQIDRED